MKIEFVISYAREILINFRFIILFSFVFGIFSLATSFIVTPLFNSGIRVMISGTSVPGLSMPFSANMFGMMGQNAVLADEATVALSRDLKGEAFASFAMKVQWHKIDNDIRHFVVFDTVPLMSEPRKMRIVPVSESRYKIYLSKKYHGWEKILEKLPVTAFEYFKTANVGEVVRLFNGSNFMITAPKLIEGKKYDIEIGYKYPREVIGELFSRLSATISPNSNVISISYTGSDPVRTTEFVNYYAQKYLRARYSKARFDGSQTALFFDERIGQSKTRIDSLQTILAEIASSEMIFMPEHEIPTSIELLMGAVDEKKMLELEYIMTKQMNPHNNMQARVIKDQKRMLNRHIEEMRQKIYVDHPGKVFNQLNATALLGAEEKILSELILKREQALLAEITEIGNRWIVERPTFPFFRIRPQRFRDLVVYLVFGFFIGVLFVAFKRFFNPLVSNVFDIDNKKIITVSKTDRQNSDKIKEGLTKIFISFNSTETAVGFIKDAYPDFDNFAKGTGLERFERFGNAPLLLETLKTKRNVIIPMKYNDVRKKDIENVIAVLGEEKVVFLVYDIEVEKHGYKWDYYLAGCTID